MKDDKMSVLTQLEAERANVFNPTILSTGISQLDNRDIMTTSDFLVIAGDSGGGKSTIALLMACSMAKAGKKIVFLNMENDNKVMLNSMKYLGFDYNADFGEFIAEKGSFYPKNLKIITLNSLKMDQVRAFVLSENPDAIFIDLFSELLAGKNKNDIPNLTYEYAVELESYTKKYNCAVIVTEQLIKDNKRRGRPTFGDIGGGSNLYKKAHKILMIYSYARDNANSLIAQGHGPNSAVSTVIELIPLKDRRQKMMNLPTRFIYMQYSKNGLNPVNAQTLLEYFDTIYPKYKDKK